MKHVRQINIMSSDGLAFSPERVRGPLRLGKITSLNADYFFICQPCITIVAALTHYVIQKKKKSGLPFEFGFMHYKIIQ